MQLLYLLEQEEQRVGGEAITQCPLKGNTVTNGNFTLFVISNHKKQIIKNKKNEGSRVGCFDDQVEEGKTTKRSLTQAVEIRLMLRT